ncbi:MAG: hypothetical protein GYB64_18480, partial [Chloroflexi bacterium]|nr:hypothetical protein [Chloroflexota bacterium]
LANHRAFLAEGHIPAENLARIEAIKAGDFPLDEGEVADLRENLAEQILALRDLEAEAVGSLQAAMD